MGHTAASFPIKARMKAEKVFGSNSTKKLCVVNYGPATVNYVRKTAQNVSTEAIFKPRAAVTTMKNYDAPF